MSWSFRKSMVCLTLLSHCSHIGRRQCYQPKPNLDNLLNCSPEIPHKVLASFDSSTCFWTVQLRAPALRVQEKNGKEKRENTFSGSSWPQGGGVHLAHRCTIFLCYLGCEIYWWKKNWNTNMNDKDHLVGQLTRHHPTHPRSSNLWKCSLHIFLHCNVCPWPRKGVGLVQGRLKLCKNWSVLGWEGKNLKYAYWYCKIARAGKCVLVQNRWKTSGCWWWL